MKKPGKLQVNPEKVMNNEELFRLRGGYGTCYFCQDCNHDELGTIYGCGLTQYEAVLACQQFYPSTCYAPEGQCS